MKKVLIMLALVMSVQVILAQSIVVDNFKQITNPFFKSLLKISPVETDKNFAILELRTEKKGFSFKDYKGEDLNVQEGDGVIKISAPDKTRYIIISHPDFGDFTWRVPVRYLKKKHCYSADLLAMDLTKQYKNPGQWVSFSISPENAIMTIDSVMYRINDGNLSLYLPVGSHFYNLEAPFYENMTDSLIVTDSLKIEKKIYLQPLYSYLTVKADDPDISIFIDEEFRGRDAVTIGRIKEGQHRVSLSKNNYWICDTVVNIEKAEKKTISFPSGNNSMHNPEILSGHFEKNPQPNIYRERTVVKNNPEFLQKELKEKKDSTIFAEIHIKSENLNSRILIDREIVATGEWQGILPSGFHLLSSEQDGFESISQYIVVEDNSPRDIILAVPKSSVGMVNIRCNIDGVTVISGNEIIGQTPLLIKDLRVDSDNIFTLYKEGYEEKRINVRPRPNDESELFIKLKKL